MCQVTWSSNIPGTNLLRCRLVQHSLTHSYLPRPPTLTHSHSRTTQAHSLTFTHLHLLIERNLMDQPTLTSVVQEFIDARVSLVPGYLTSQGSLTRAFHYWLRTRQANAPMTSLPRPSTNQELIHEFFRLIPGLRFEHHASPTPHRPSNVLTFVKGIRLERSDAAYVSLTELHLPTVIRWARANTKPVLPSDRNFSRFRTPTQVAYEHFMHTFVEVPVLRANPRLIPNISRHTFARAMREIPTVEDSPIPDLGRVASRDARSRCYVGFTINGLSYEEPPPTEGHRQGPVPLITSSHIPPQPPDTSQWGSI